jgi:hypothetical protein
MTGLTAWHRSNRQWDRSDRYGYNFGFEGSAFDWAKIDSCWSFLSIICINQDALKYKQEEFEGNLAITNSEVIVSYSYFWGWLLTLICLWLKLIMDVIPNSFILLYC